MRNAMARPAGHRPAVVRWFHTLALGLGGLIAACAAVSTARAADDAAPLSRYVPRQGLVSYIEFQGFDAHDKDWHRSAAYKVLNETKLGALIEDMFTQFVTQTGAPINPGDLIGAFKLGVQKGFAMGVWGNDPDELEMVIVLRDGGKPEIRRVLELMTRAGRPVPAPAPAEEEKGQPAARKIEQMPGSGQVSYWYEKNDLVITSSPDTIIALLDASEKGATDHPTRQALLKGEDGIHPFAIAFADITGLPKLPPQAVSLGLDGVKRVELVLGFDGDAMQSVIRAIAPAPRKGLLALADQPTFDAKSLPPIPAGVKGFITASIDWSRSYDRVAELIRTTRPGGPDPTGAIEEGVKGQLGFDLRKDLLGALGHSLTFSFQEPANKPASHAATMINRAGGATLSLEIRDAAALERSREGIVKLADLLLAQALGQQPGAGGLQLKKQEGAAQPTYTLDLPEGMIPPPFNTLFRPTLIFGKERLVLGASTEPAEKVAALSAAKPDGRWQPDEACAAVMKRLPGKLVYLRINDPRETIPAVVEALPIFIQMINEQIKAQRRQFPGRPGGGLLKVEQENLPTAQDLIARLYPSSTAVTVDDQSVTVVTREPIPGITSPTVFGMYFALLMPAVTASREAAARAQCVNNMKQIGLAFHNAHSANNAFPAPAITDKDGKPLLSWRVAILPYIGQQELYNKFKLDEPWDSPNNKPLIEQMPVTYKCPSRKNVAAGTTHYRVFVGEGAMFSELGDAVGLQNITDGTSNTILVVEAGEGVPWTKPEGIKFDPNAKAGLLGADSPHPGGFNALFADGSVRFIKKSIHVIVLKALLTRASGEVVSSDSY